MKRLYITGSGGFVGQHIVRLVAEGAYGDCEVVAGAQGLDIRNQEAVLEDIERCRPDWVLHLAAQSFVPESFVNPAHTFDVNLGGTLSLLEGLKKASFGGRVLYVSSGDVYGAVAERELPVKETQLPAPRNPYAVSKVAAELLCRQRYFSDGLDVIIARPFNHIGPGQGTQFVVPGLASQVARVVSGLQEPVITVGSIDVSRDFSDVRDIARAYAALFRSGQPGEIYNVCSGKEVKIAEVLDRLCQLAGVVVDIRQDDTRVRPNEQRRMVASAEKLTRDTGWTPERSLDDSLAEILKNFEMKGVR